MADEIDLDALTDILASEARTADDTPHDAQGSAAVTTTQDDGDDDDDDDKQRQRRKRHKRRHARRRDDDDGDDDDDATHARHKRPRSKYVLDAAESGDSADDFIDDDDDNDNDDDGRGEALLAARAAQEQSSQPPRERFLFHEGDAQMTADELGREYEARVRALRAQRAAARQRGGGGGDAAAARSRMQSSSSSSSLRYAAQLLPHDTDPKVFAVKCRPRMTRLLVARLVNKCYAFRVGRNYEHKRVDLGIISIFCLDHVREYIYVEAYRKLFVENALNGLEGVFRYQIAVVDPSELMQMMERRPSASAAVRVGALVRLRQRHYRNDLAQVVEVHRDGTHVTCRVVPREDFVGKPYSKPTTRLPPRFFVPSLAVDVEDCGGYVRWGECRFDKEGYLLKTVSTRSLLVSGSGSGTMAAPTAEELARFYRNNRERVREAIARAASTITGGTPSSSAADGGGGASLVASSGGGGGIAAAELRLGDTVRVVAGQLRNTVGRVVNLFTSSGTALLSCAVPGRAEPLRLRVELSACVRCFAEGTHVLVEKGMHAGESGTVIRSHGDTVLLFPDRASTATELRVRANDCHQSTLVGSFSHSYNAWRLFDLVALSDMNVVACIVHLSPHDVDVLTEHNERRTLTYAQIKPVGQSAAAGGSGGGGGGAARKTMDRMQNVLTRGAEVAIQRTALTPFHLGGQTGRVEQVYNRTLFVHCRAVSEHAGIVALDADCVLLRGGRTSLRHAAAPRELPRPQHRPHNATRADAASSLDDRAHDDDWRSRSEWYEPSSTA